MSDSLGPEWLEESDGRTIFEGDVLRLVGEPHGFDVQRGGWSFDKGTDTWLTHNVLARFEGRRVRVTVEDLGPSSVLAPKPAYLVD